MKTAAASKTRTRPPCNPKWHAVARRFYMSLEASGQSKFYEPSDWALAYLVAESISRELRPQPLIDAKGRTITDAKGKPIMVERPPKGASLAAWIKAMSELLVSEGARRRLQIELDLPDEPPAGEDGGGSVSNIDAWRSRTDGTG